MQPEKPTISFSRNDTDDNQYQHIETYSPPIRIEDLACNTAPEFATMKERVKRVAAFNYSLSMQSK